MEAPFSLFEKVHAFHVHFCDDISQRDVMHRAKTQPPRWAVFPIQQFVWLSLNHSVRVPVSRSAGKAVKSDAFASVETSDAAGGHWSRTLRVSCFLPLSTSFRLPVPLVRASRTNLTLTKKQLAE